MFGNKNTQVKEPIKGSPGTPTQGALNRDVYKRQIQSTLNKEFHGFN